MRAKAIGRLKNGARAAPIETAWAAPRCTATSKRTGQPCRAAAMRGKAVCYHHGGRSTGIKTAQGMASMRRANTKIGLYVGPGHPDFDTAGPRWPGHGKDGWRAGLKTLRQDPLTKDLWAQRRSGPVPVRDAQGRFRGPLTNEEMAALVPDGWRDQE